jgi:Cu-Zn family superoxide dismutase
MARATVSLSAFEGAIKGRLVFEQESFDAPTVISGDISGLAPGKHALSVNVFGDVSSAESVGMHFNPHSRNHGAPEDEERHVGDLGNIEANADGKVTVKIHDRFLKLIGPLSVIGRSLCISKRQDDSGKGGHESSLRTGNAGEVVAAGVIGIQA